MKAMSRNKRQLIAEDTRHAVNATRLVSLLALRNAGYGRERLQRFADAFDEILLDMAVGRLTLNDIKHAIADEIGVDVNDDLYSGKRP